MLWTETEIQRLRELARTDLSFNAIGAELQRSKHAVRRKVHDLNLRSPEYRRVIRLKNSTPQSRHEKMERAGKTTLPTLASLQPNEQE
jgi:hypothetical protein